MTTRTKAVVAQHSFGIPCNIAEIQELYQKRGLALIEDCAVTLDSAFDDIKVGNWGDAAIFSTDHSKPLNTLVGGFFYTKDKGLSAKVRGVQEASPPLSQNHQPRLFQQFLFERHYYQPENHHGRMVLHYLRRISKKIGRKGSQPVFMEKDYNKYLPNHSLAEYPYPAKMPPFLARIGLMELARWGRERQRRKDLLQDYLCLTRGGGWGHYLPKAYENRHVDIVPLRFVFTHHEAEKITRHMARFIDVSWIWFRSPIICTDSIEELGYAPGSCPQAESIGSAIINWPCVVSEQWCPQLLEHFKSLVNASL
jgi:perosamine synthetase